VNKEQDPETQNDMLVEFIKSLPNDSTVRAIGLPIVRELAGQHPANSETMELFGWMLELNNQLDSAAWAFNASLRIKSSVEVWQKLLDIYDSKRDGDSLVKNSERFIRQYPNSVDPYRYNALGHYIKKEYDKAVKAINRAIDNQPEGNRAALALLYSFMGEIYHTNKQDEFSDKAYDKAVELNPEDAGALNNFAYSLSERGKRLDDAERMSKKSLDIRPGEATFLDTYGWILYKKGDYEKARVFVKRAVDIAGANADGTLYDHLGNIYYKLNNREKAVENWKIAKERGADDQLIDKKISEAKLYE
jgi:tetratricopeptide (TPR) repeat protein